MRRLVAVLALLLALWGSPLARAATFGKTAVGASSLAPGAQYKYANKATLSESASISSISIYLRGGAAAQNVRAALYGSSGSAPGSLLGVTAEKTIAASQAAGWVRFDFSTPLTVAAGTYYLTEWTGPSSSPAFFYYDVGVSGDLQYNPQTYSSTGSPSNPFGTATISPGNEKVSIYATYTPTTQTGTFGKTTVGPNWLAPGANYKLASKETLFQTATVKSISLYVRGGAASQHLRYALYGDSAGAPGALLGVTNETVVAANQAAGWVTLNLPTPLTEPAGTYWLTTWAGSSSSVAQYAFSPGVSGNYRFNPQTYSATSPPSNPFGSSTISPGNEDISIYATFTAPTPVFPKWGISDGANIVYEADATRISELNSMQAAGAKAVRYDFAWSVIQQTQGGAYNFGYLDTAVAEAQARGMTVLAMVGFTPPWANGGQTDDKYPPTDASQFATFAGAVAAHFGPLGVHFYEIWNEPNLGCCFWKPTASPDAYAALVKAAYPAIHAADSQAEVLVGALSPAGGYNDANCDGVFGDVLNSEGNENPVNFLERLYQLGTPSDVVSHHPYDGAGFTGRCSGWAQMQDTSPSLRSIMTQYSDSAKPIFATEYGNQLAWVGGNEQAQADRLTQAMNLWKAYPWAGSLFKFNLWDAGADAYGMLRPNFTQRPKWFAYQAGATG